MLEDESMARQREAALSLITHSKNRNDLIRFYKELAGMGNKKISASMKKEDKSFKGLKDAEKLLEKNIANIAKKKKPGELEIARISLAMFLLDRANRVHEIVLKDNSLGKYSLYISMRNRIIQMLGNEFYSMDQDEMLSEYLDTEPVVTACSELCGIAAASASEAVRIYKYRLAERLGKKESASKSKTKKK
ncbi:hypothetical protein GF318_04100 [Candidatus Micrarchaeota archaeon]|nr:hypothetical protein [Candidatus Micrarchaeota archaeon]